MPRMSFDIGEEERASQDEQGPRLSRSGSGVEDPLGDMSCGLSRRISADPLGDMPCGLSREISSAVFPGPPDTGMMSANGLTCNMVLSIVGTTVLGICAQMKAGGWLLAPALLCLGCAIVTEMTRLVSETIDQMHLAGKPSVRSYQDFAEGAFGPAGRRISSVTSTFALLGMIGNGLILESSNIQFAAPIPWEWPLGCDPDKDCKRKWWALILTSLTLLFSFVEPGPLLQKSAAFGPAVSLLCIFLALLGNGMAIADLSNFPESCKDGASEPYQRLLPDTSEGFLAVLMNVGGIAAYGFYCFAVVVTVPSLKGQMARPTELVWSSAKAYVICTGWFLAIMLTGYWGFGALGPENLIYGMRRDRPVGWWALSHPWETGEGTISGKAFAWMIIINLLLTDAIYVPCTVLALEGWAPDFFAGASWRRVAVRLGLGVFRLLIATQVESFVALTNLTSSCFCVCNNILMPVVAYHRTGTAGSAGAATKAAHALIFLFGCFVMALGSYGAVFDIVWREKKSAAATGVFPRDGISAACRAAYEEAVGQASSAAVQMLAT